MSAMPPVAHPAPVAHRSSAEDRGEADSGASLEPVTIAPRPTVPNLLLGAWARHGVALTIGLVLYAGLRSAAWMGI